MSKRLEVSNFSILFDLIGELARRRYQTAERYFSVLQLNHTEARLLTLLSRADGTSTQEALSNQLFIDRSNAGRALKNLEDEGYVERCPCDSDKRTKLVQITDKGRVAVAEIAKLKEQMATGFFGELSEAEAGEVIALLRKVGTSEQDA